MTNELKLFRLALINLSKDKHDDDDARELVRLTFQALSSEEKDLIHLSCNADVCEIIW